MVIICVWLNNILAPVNKQGDKIMSQSIRKSVMQASKQWIANFNEGNVQACIKRYMSNASMSVTPFGKFDGINAIGEFWQQFATKKPTNLVYRNVQIKVLNERQAVLSANWTMNIAIGFISKELWTLAGDGKWYLQEDDFSVLSQHDSPIPHSKRTALVLVDLQNDYFENGRFELENTYAVSVQAKQLLTTFRQHEMPVIHIQHIFESEEAPFFAPNTSGADIAKHLAPLANEPVIVKHEIDSFSNTSLEQTLVELGVEKLA